MGQNDKPTALPVGNVILFDGTCVFCSGFARFIVWADRKKQFRFVTAHSATGRVLFEAHQLDPDLIETNIVMVDGKPYLKFRAFAAAMRAIGWPWRIFWLIAYLPRGVSDTLYDFVARNRYRIAGQRACPMPSPELKARLIE